MFSNLKQAIRFRTEIRESKLERYKSEFSDRDMQLEMIKSALTQRYNRKFQQLQRQLKSQQELRQQSEADLKNQSIIQQLRVPKFVINRQYISFDYKGKMTKNATNRARQLKKITNKLRIESNQQDQQKFRGEVKQKEKVFRYYSLPKCQSWRAQAGHNFLVTNINPKLKSFLTKKNLPFMNSSSDVEVQQKVNTSDYSQFVNNKQHSVLQEDRITNLTKINIRKTKKIVNQTQNYQSFRQSDKIRQDLEGANNDQCMDENKQKENLKKKEKDLKKEKFRPWSGFSDDEKSIFE